jgi:tricorn protease
MRRPTLLLLSATLSTFAGAEGVVGYYRFPTIRGDVVVFAAEGDLWRVGVGGGTASRLTSHLAEESHPSISPDGSTIAFSASYEGPTEVYTMPIAGGVPQRRTFEGERALVVGWTPEGRLLFKTGRYSTLPDTQLVSLDLASGTLTRLPLSQASDGCYGSDGKTFFFTRQEFQGSHTKRYEGGTAQNIWKLADGAAEAVPLTADYAGTSKTPMCWQGRVFFASDREGTMNLWSMDEQGKDLRQLTHHEGWDVASPALDGGRIVYQLGADLGIFDAGSGRDATLDVRLASDFDQVREAWVKKPMDYLTSAALSPTGDRIALTARGQVFVAPAKQGRIVEVHRNPGVRFRKARFLPDGGSLVVLSDESGEVELWTLPANGVGTSSQLTRDGDVLRWEAVPSPDGKSIAHHDKNQRLWVYSVEKKTETRIATSDHGDFQDLAWSPDSRWLAYSVPVANTFSQLFVYDAQEGTTTAATTDRYDSGSPAWSPDGEWLYFLSDRNLKSLVRSPWGPRQPDPFLGEPTELYAVALKKDYRSPFAPVDELHPEKPKEDEKEKTGQKDDKASKDGKSAKEDEKAKAATRPVTIDLPGLAERLVRVPLPGGRYASLATDGKRLYFLSRGLGDDAKTSLQALPIEREKAEVKTVLEDVRDYELSADGKKLLVRRKDDLYVFDAGDKAPDKLDESKVDLRRWTFSFDPREQWRQMFVEAWRLERDYFYDRGMHGLDWPAVRRRYEPLVARVTSRGELNDLLGQMVSELSALHIFVGGGDQRKGEDDVEVGWLGAELTRDEGAGGYRVTRVYRSDPDEPGGLSPLARSEVRVEEGDVVESINGVATLSVADPSLLLRNQAGRQVLLHVKPREGEARDAIAVPLTRRQAADLRYDDWEYSRRQAVEKAGEGRIGYVHLRAMGRDNFTEWAKDYYPVFNREGLVIDVRHNRGGNIDSWILGKLLRKAWFYWQPRVGAPYWNMQYAFRGHVVVLVDEHTASDGEAFAEGFRRLGMGKIIGTRTWGGEIWLTSSNVLVDHGIATAAEFGVYGPEGSWLIEGHGVDPDVVVDNPPRATFEGEDEQLDAAIHYLKGEIARAPVPVPPAPAYPKKAVPAPPTP